MQTLVVRLVSLAAIIWIAASPLTHAQQAATPSPLPVRRVVLYKSGVGYFEHLGRVRGNQTVTIDFTSGQLDDVLKSLTALDLDGGRVSGVNYNSEAGLDRRLGALRLPVGEQATRMQLLNALRGAKVDVRSGTVRTLGRLLSVEQVQRPANNSVMSVEAVSIVTDAGEIVTIALEPGVSVKIVETDLNEEVSKYLTAVASVRDQDVRRLTISTAGNGQRDLFVSYVSEVPVWKATYRIVLSSAEQKRQPLLQGWAIIDNTIGEDWENVQLSLVAGAPQSFVQTISKPYYVQRPVVPLPSRVSLSPQTHQGALAVEGAAGVGVTVTDADGSLVPGATVRVTRGGALLGSVATDARGIGRVTGLTPGAYDVQVSLNGFKTINISNVVVSAGMESVVPVRLELGAREEVVNVRGSSTLLRTDGFAASPAAAGGRAGGGGGGRGGGAPRPDATEEVSLARQNQQVDAVAAQLGDLFEYKIKEPVTIRKNSSALVPIVSADVQAEKVSLWNAVSGGTRALRALWLTNATRLTLDGGSFSVIEGEAFAGEGLMEPLKAGEKRLLSFAVDLGMTIDAKSEPVPGRITRITVNKGLLFQQTEERQHRVYSARNDDAEARTLIIEHPVRVGWALGGAVKPVESTPQWHRYRITVEPKSTATFTVEESRSVQTQVAVSSVTDSQILVLVREKALSPALEAALRDVLVRKTEVARLSGEVSRRQTEIDQIGRDQERVRENMRSLKGSSEERQLLQRYVKQLDDQETRIETLRKDIEAIRAELRKAEEDLARFIAGLTF